LCVHNCERGRQLLAGTHEPGDGSLAPIPLAVLFIPTFVFKGRKAEYWYRTGEQGTGYYHVGEAGYGDGSVDLSGVVITDAQVRALEDDAEEAAAAAAAVDSDHDDDPDGEDGSRLYGDMEEVDDPAIRLERFIRMKKEKAEKAVAEDAAGIKIRLLEVGTVPTWFVCGFCTGL
jgi:hypothetical protein